MTRASGVFGAWLAVIAGVWFAIGPAVSRTWETAEGPIGRPLYGSTRQMLELVGYFYGLGALLMGLGAFAIGRFAPARRVTEAPGTRAGERAAAPADGAAAWPSAGAPAARSTRGEYGPRRRVPFLRRGRAAGAGRGQVAREAPARSDQEVPAR